MDRDFSDRVGLPFVDSGVWGWELLWLVMSVSVVEEEELLEVDGLCEVAGQPAAEFDSDSALDDGLGNGRRILFVSLDAMGLALIRVLARES